MSTKLQVAYQGRFCSPSDPMRELTFFTSLLVPGPSYSPRLHIPIFPSGHNLHVLHTWTKRQRSNLCQSMRSINSCIQYPKCRLFIPAPEFEVYFATEGFITFTPVDRGHPFTAGRNDGSLNTGRFEDFLLASGNAIRRRNFKFGNEGKCGGRVGLKRGRVRRRKDQSFRGLMEGEGCGG